MSKYSLAGSAGKISNKTFKRFLEELGSKNPTPGGGAVAAMSGAMAASLVEMVCNLTKDKRANTLKTKALKYKKEFQKLADDDVDAFNLVMKNWKTNKRKSSLKKAADVPLKVALLSVEVEKLAKQLIKFGNKNAYSDTKTAIHLSKAAKASALENVKINLVMIKDKRFTDRVKKAIIHI